jgi:hypothetical protein
MTKRRMILGAGLQSGGTTLISWCFLQRRDTNGVLDMRNDIIHTSFEKVQEPICWVKMTIGAFRWLDVSEVYQDLGWKPEPLLIVRDVRTTYASLMKKDYGFNGTTAEDPPLRLRFRRFLRDWDLFRANGWPLLKYEDFIQDEERAGRDICAQLSLPWDEGMITWPKQPAEIAYIMETNETFTESIGKGSLKAANLKQKAQLRIDGLPLTELQWLETTFSSYNAFHKYPPCVRPTCPAPIMMASPRFEGTRRHWHESEEYGLWAFNAHTAKKEIAGNIPGGETLVLVDDAQLGSTLLSGQHAIPFLERDNQDWGPPADDGTAISELARLRQSGANFIVFAWPAFWWLEYYSEFSRHLRSHYRCILENERLVVFDLRRN